MSYNRKAILERDNYICQLCGVDTRAYIGLVHPSAPHVDHIIPRSRGGSDDESNLRCLCYRCNQAKGPFLDEEISSNTPVDCFHPQNKGSQIGGAAYAEWARKHPELAHENAAKGGPAAVEWSRKHPELASEIGRKAGCTSAHRRYHTRRALTSPNCNLCWRDAFAQARLLKPIDCVALLETLFTPGFHSRLVGLAA